MGTDRDVFCVRQSALDDFFVNSVTTEEFKEVLVPLAVKLLIRSPEVSQPRK